MEPTEVFSRFHLAEDELNSKVIALLQTTLDNIRKETAGLYGTGWTPDKVAATINAIRSYIDDLTRGLISVTEDNINTFLNLGVSLGNVGGPTTYGVGASVNMLRGLVSYRADRITGVTDELKDRISEIVRRASIAGKPVGKLVEELGRITPRGAGPMGDAAYRVTTIIKVECGRVLMIAAFDRMLDSLKYIPGLKKRWITTMHNSRPTHIQANGQTVPVEQPFEVGGEELMFPLDPAGSAENVVNCRCLMVPVLP